jgi:hypothetical protein
MTTSSKKRRKKIILTMAMALMQTMIILLQKKAKATNSRSYRKPNIGRTRTKKVNLCQCLGHTIFRRAY